MKITKKILLSLWLCVATNMLHASVEDLIDKLGECKDGMDKLVQALGDIGKEPDEGDGGTGAPPPPPPGGPGDLGAPPPPDMGTGPALTWQQKIALSKAAAKKAGKKPSTKSGTGETGGTSDTGGKGKTITGSGKGGVLAGSEKRLAKQKGKEEGNEQAKSDHKTGATVSNPRPTEGDSYENYADEILAAYIEGFNEGYDVGWKEAEAKAAKPKTPSPKPDEPKAKKAESPKTPPAKTPSPTSGATGSQAGPKKATVTPPPGATKPTPTFAAPKKEEKLQDFTGKIDYLEIPNYEALYQAYLRLYFDGEFASSRLGGDLVMGHFSAFSGYQPEDVAAIKDVIGRAVFERNVLEYCREQIIQKYDPNRTRSRADALLVHREYLSKIIAKVVSAKDEKGTDSIKSATFDVKDSDGKPATIAGSDIHALLERTAIDHSGAVNDLFYHRERREGSDRVSCACLTEPLMNGYHSSYGHLSEDKRIPKEHPLRLPITLLVFETMHITLFHGVMFTNPLIGLFDFSKDLKAEVAVKDKTKFKVGFDTVFEDMMGYIVSDEKKIKEGLFRGNQLKDDGSGLGNLPELKLLFLGQKEPQTRTVIYGKIGKLDEYGIKKPDIFWSQGAVENWPDRMSHTNTVDYETMVTRDELLYALRYHMLRHTCYSVGLLPENFIPVLKLDDKMRAKVIEIEAESHVNETVKKLLLKKAEGLRRVMWIVAYLQPRFISLTGKEKPIIIAGIFKEIDNKTKNPENKNKGVQLRSITQDEWNKVFKKLYEDAACAKKVGEAFGKPQFTETLSGNITDVMQEGAKKVAIAIIEAQAAAAA